MSSDSVPRSSPAKFLRGPYRPRSQSPPPSVAGSSSETAVGSSADTDTLLSHSLPPKHKQDNHRFPPHKPVSALKLFASDAVPLHLPQLDAHLSSITLPDFTGAHYGAKSMFTPMDKLVARGWSLDDLEFNSRVTPSWRNRKSILQWIVNMFLGFAGSSALTTYYSLQGVMNTVQIFALILNTIVPVGDVDLANSWRKLLLGTIPNILALNFATNLLESLVFLLVFMCITGVLLFFFWKKTVHCERYSVLEGLQSKEKPGQAGIIAVTFLLTIFYLPLSTMSIHVLVWSQDLWTVSNPYINATSLPPVLDPLGPSNQYRDPLDFCWTTTMKKNEINFAPAAVIAAAAIFIALTIWFPIALYRVIRKSVPRIDKYNDLGRLRSKVDMEHEYQRLLDRDKSAFAFIYSGYRREWGIYQAVYLLVKLSALVITAVLDADNCVFRGYSRSTVSIVSQVLLLVITFGLFLEQCFLAPFINPINNASEWISRLSFVLTSAISLAISLNAPGKGILETYILYSLYVITYFFTFYFLIIDVGLVQNLLKRLTRRIDFSIDIFSPRLDLSSSSIHTRRRIWQESVSTVLLTSKECRIPRKQQMIFSEARDVEYPPYLLHFTGTPGERHVENLKILRETGLFAYQRAVAFLSGPDRSRYKKVSETIQRQYVGPDCYWRPVSDKTPVGCTKYFGHAWWIPFPFTLVIRYDDGSLAVLNDLTNFESYIAQNESHDIQRRRQIRLAVRSLEGQKVYWPHQHVTNIGSQSGWFYKQRYSAKKSVYMDRCTLRISRQGFAEWKKLALGSGFGVQLVYKGGVVIDGSSIGLDEDVDLTAPLARFLGLNESVIETRLPILENVLQSYRDHLWKESCWKEDVLSYAFQTRVYEQPRDPAALASSSIKAEPDIRVRRLLLGSGSVFQTAHIRLQTVSKSPITIWWYLFWDDVWRRNHKTTPNLELHQTDFCPYYPTSIAYRPLPRSALETFLVQRGLLSNGQIRSFFNTGLLNLIYLRMHEIVFRSSSRAAIFHIGDRSSEFNMDGIDAEMHANPSTVGTGGGTDYDDASQTRPRPAFYWEDILTDPLQHQQQTHKNFFGKVRTWFGINPVWKSRIPSLGIAVDVRLEKGKYVLLDDDSQLSNFINDTRSRTS